MIPPQAISAKPRSTSSNSAVAERLYSSPTKAVTAKYRAERTASDGAHMISVLKADLNGGRSTNSLPRRGKRERKSAEEDSGNFSSSEENTDFVNNVVDLVTPSVNKQNLIHGTSDDELSIEELRRKQRQKRRDYLNQRRESPSPTKRNSSPSRGRKSSDEGASDSSYSPPASPSMIFRSTSNKSRGSPSTGPNSPHGVKFYQFVFV